MNKTEELAQFWGNEWKFKETQNYFSEEEKKFLIQYKYSIMKPILKKLTSGSKVLEVGCGNSFWLRLIRKDFPNLEFHGLDISDDALAISKKFKIKTKKGDIRNAPYKDNTFEFIFSLGVVEHFPETEKAILEHIRILKKGHQAFIETPNKINSHKLEYLTGNFLFHHKTKAEIMLEHGKWYSSNDLSNMANRWPNKITIKRFGSGPILPLMTFTSIIDKMLPAALRKRYGGNAGILVTKC